MKWTKISDEKGIIYYLDIGNCQAYVFKNKENQWMYNTLTKSERGYMKPESSDKIYSSKREAQTAVEKIVNLDKKVVDTNRKRESKIEYKQEEIEKEKRNGNS